MNNFLAGATVPDPLPVEQIQLGSNEYDIVEDSNGDLVIRDDNGNDVLIWDKSAGQWDFKSQNIANVASISTDELFTEPAGVRLQKSSDQSAGNNSLIDPVTWGSATEYNSTANAFADLANNKITIPTSDYSYAKLRVSIFMNSQVEFDFWDVQKNGGNFNGQFQVRDLADTQSMVASTSWVSVSNGDSFKVRFRQVSGSSVDIKANTRTFFELEAL